jgi:HK97 family phage major capsid protein
MLTEDLIKDLKGTLATFKERSASIVAMETTVNALETKMTLLEASAGAPRHRDLQEWDSEAHAKRFCDWSRELHIQDAATLRQMSETDSEGGYMVPEEFRATLLRLIDTFGFVRRTSRNFPMSTDSIKMPVLDTSVSVYWTA